MVLCIRRFGDLSVCLGGGWFVCGIRGKGGFWIYLLDLVYVEEKGEG